MAAPIPKIPKWSNEKAGEDLKNDNVFCPTSIQRAACGNMQTLVIGLKGDTPQLYAFGKNHNNMLGLGISIKEEAYPTWVSFFSKHSLFEVSCGVSHTVVLVKDLNKSGGKLYSFGLGNRGRLGYPKTLKKEDDADEDSWFTPKPMRIKFKDDIRIARISCGSDHTLAITNFGKLYAWGVGTYGCLGTNDTNDRYYPTRISIAKGAFVVQCSAGDKHSMACTQDGILWTWGYGANGRLGLGHTRGVFVPTAVEHLRDKDIVFVSAGDLHSACIDKLGVLYTWGSGSYGKLGHGDEADSFLPRKVEAFGGNQIIQIACGTFHNLALSKSGQVYTWGAGVALGEAERNMSFVGHPYLLQNIETSAIFVTVGPYHSVVITVSGNMYCWGDGGGSKLGHGDQQHKLTPFIVGDLRNRVHVADLKLMLGIFKKNIFESEKPTKDNFEQKAIAVDKWKIQAVSLGDMHSAFLTAAGDLWICGSNEFGQLAVGQQGEDDEHIPFHAEFFKDPIRKIACGGNHCLVVDFEGLVYAWGLNDKGQLGIGTTQNLFIPEIVSSLKNALNVFAGEDYSACITGGIGYDQSKMANYGDLWTWGSAETGKLGLGEKFASGAVLVPQKVDLGKPVWKCSLGSSHMIALTKNGTAYAWGSGYYGKLGLGNNSNSFIPARVKFPGNTKLQDVVAAEYHSIALSTNFSLFAWGRNSSICSVEHVYIPTLFLQIDSPEGVPKVKHVCACRSHSFAVTTDGNVWAWGDNKKFQLGVGKKSAEHFDKPEMLSTLPSPVDVVYTASEHSIAILLNGDLYAWGSAVGGRLGVGYKKKKIVHSPELVVPQWSINKEMSVNMLFLDNEKFNREESLVNLEDLNISIVNDFLSQIAFESMDNTKNISWGALQKLIQAEEVDNRQSSIKAFEDDLISIMSRHFDFILTLEDKEMELNLYEEDFQNSLISAVSYINTDYPTLCNNDVPDILLTKLKYFEELIWILQQQPAYLVSLMSCVKANNTEKHTILDSFKFIFYEVTDTRVENLMCCLLRAVANNEIKRASNVLSLFSPETSMLFHVFRLISQRDIYMFQYLPHILDISNENSLIAALLRMLKVKNICFALSLEDFVKKKDLPSVSDMTPKQLKELHYNFHEAIETMRTFFSLVLVKFLSSFRLPKAFRLILKIACDSIYNRGLPLDYEYLQYGVDLCYNIPLIKLILNAILQPIFSNPNKFINLLCLPKIEEENVIYSLETCATFFENMLEDSFKPTEIGHLLESMVMELNLAMMNVIKEQTNLEDNLDADLVIDVFRTHLEMKSHFVCLSSEVLTALVNLCKLYEAQLNLSAHDPVAKLVKEISDKSNPPFNKNIIQQCILKKTWHSFQMNQRFLLKEKNLLYCPITQAPIPQRLAPRQMPYTTRDGQRILSLVKRYVPPENYDPRYILQECIRVIPPIKAKDWPKLKKELEIIAESYSALSPPDYEKANKVFEAAKKVEELHASNVSTHEVMKWIVDGIKERKMHRRCLHYIQKNESIIGIAERNYSFTLNKHIESIKEAISFANNLEYEESIKAKSKLMGIPLFFERIPKIQKKIGNTEAKKFSPSLTLTYMDLKKQHIVVWISPSAFPEDILQNLHFTFTLLPLGGWKIVLTHCVKEEKREVVQFEISRETISQLRKASPEAVLPYLVSEKEKQGMFKMHNFNFLVLLHKIVSS